jgi:hypothetical protein
MDTHVTAHPTIESETAASRARLPGEPEEAPLVSERVGVDDAGVADADGPMATPGVDPGERPATSAPPQSRRRQRLLAGAAVVALAAAGASAFLISPYNHVYPSPRMASVVRDAAASAGIQIPAGIVAPSAKLADVALPQRVPIVHAPYTPAAPAQDMHDLLALHALGPIAPTPTPPPPLAASEHPLKPATALGSPVASVAPSAAPVVHPAQFADQSASDRPRLAGPPPGYVPTEPGAEPPAESPTTAPRAEPGATPPGRLAAAATPPVTAANPDVPATGLATIPPQHDPARDALAALHPIVVAPSAEKALAAGADPAIAPRPSAASAKASPQTPPPAEDVVVIARELHPGPMTPKDQVAVLGMVTELATMVGDLRSEAKALRNDMRKSAADNAARLGDLDRRMAMVEARDALTNARDAGLAPQAADLAPVPAQAPPASPVTAVPIRLTRADTALPPAAPGTLTRYKVQAASPGLAMLAQVDRSGGDGAQIEVRVGDNLPGYGRVKSIGQKGATWVVTTEHGDIS